MVEALRPELGAAQAGLWLRLFRRRQHDLLPVAFNFVLLVALLVTFCDLLGEASFCRTAFFSFHALLLVSMVAQILVSNSGEPPPPELREEESSSLQRPPGLPSALQADGTWVVGAGLTSAAVCSLLACLLEPLDEERCWFAAASYAMYLFHSLVEDLFLCLLRCDLEGAAADGGLREMFAPLLRAPPFFWLTAKCFHTVARGGRQRGQEKRVTHQVKEWLPYSAWADETEFPREDIHGVGAPVFLSVSVRIRGDAALSAQKEAFERVHRKDQRQTYAFGVLVARFDSKHEWVGLSGGRRGLAARYALASLLFCAVPWRLAFTSRAFSLRLLVVKRLAFGGDVPPGFQPAPPMPAPNCSTGCAEHWAFGESAANPGVPDTEPLPSIFLSDFGLHWLQGRPGVVAPLCCAFAAAEVLLASVSARSRGLKLAAALVMVPLVWLEGRYAASFLHATLKRSEVCSRILGALLGGMAFVAAVVMVGNAFWVPVEWEGWQNPGPSSVAGLAGVLEERAWSLHLTDGFVDVADLRSSHATCQNVHHRPTSWPCNFIFAAPIYQSAASLDRKALPAPLAWAVSVGVHPRNVFCKPEGGLCGFAARRLFSRPKLRGFLDLLPGPSDPPTMVVVDPEEYVRPRRRAFLVAFAALLLVSPLGLGLLHRLVSRIAPAPAEPSAVRSVEPSGARLGTEGQGLLVQLEASRRAEDGAESASEAAEDDAPPGSPCRGQGL